MRRKMNALTMPLSSSERSAPFFSCSSVAPGSRLARMGFSKCLRNAAGEPSTPGLQKFTIEKNCAHVSLLHVKAYKLMHLVHFVMHANNTVTTGLCSSW